VVKQSNIFYRLTREDENSTTEILANLLKIKFFRDICLEYFGIPKEIYEKINSDDIITQRHIEDVGIPDIRIKIDKSLYIIENKINTGTDLQRNQKESYPDIIAKSKNGKYIFLIPEGYSHEKEIKDEIVEKYPQLEVVIKFWNDFLNDLSKFEIDKYSPIIKESLEYLKDMILGIPEDFTLTNYEVAYMYNPKEIYNVLSLLEKNLKLFEKMRNVIIDKYGDIFSRKGDPQKNKNGWGVYLQSTKKVDIFLGLSPNIYSEENGDYVYSLAFDSKQVKEVFWDTIDKKKFPLFRDKDNIYIQIDRKLFLDENQEENLKKRIFEIEENFKKRIFEIIDDVFMKI
jgi:hypothetical protein